MIWILENLVSILVAAFSLQINIYNWTLACKKKHKQESMSLVLPLFSGLLGFIFSVRLFGLEYPWFWLAFIPVVSDIGWVASIRQIAIGFAYADQNIFRINRRYTILTFFALLALFFCWMKFIFLTDNAFGKSICLSIAFAPLVFVIFGVFRSDTKQFHAGNLEQPVMDD